MSTWKWIRHNGERLLDVGIAADGTLHNPNGYAEDIVRAAIAGAEERRRERRSNAAQKAAITRAARKERKVYEVVARLRDNGQLVPGNHCEICGKGLDDPGSKERGIGSDCWQFILSHIDGRTQPTGAA